MVSAGWWYGAIVGAIMATAEVKSPGNISLDLNMSLGGVDVKNKRWERSKPGVSLSLAKTIGERKRELVKTKHLTVEAKMSLAEAKIGAACKIGEGCEYGFGLAGPTVGGCGKTCQPMLLFNDVDFCLNVCAGMGPQVGVTLSKKGPKIGWGPGSIGFGGWFEYGPDFGPNFDIDEYWRSDYVFFRTGAGL